MDPLDSVVQLLKERIDPTVEGSDNSAQLSKRKAMEKFINSHCRSRHYFFSVKKCTSPDCGACGPLVMDAEEFGKLHHLPDPVPDDSGEHYKPFNVRKPSRFKRFETHKRIILVQPTTCKRLIVYI